MMDFLYLMYSSESEVDKTDQIRLKVAWYQSDRHVSPDKQERASESTKKETNSCALRVFLRLDLECLPATSMSLLDSW